MQTIYQKQRTNESKSLRKYWVKDKDKLIQTH